jgi:hypothetical protein
MFASEWNALAFDPSFDLRRMARAGMLFWQGKPFLLISHWH